jgi:hypothetical protein
LCGHPNSLDPLALSRIIDHFGGFQIVLSAATPVFQEALPIADSPGTRTTSFFDWMGEVPVGTCAAPYRKYLVRNK